MIPCLIRAGTIGFAIMVVLVGSARGENRYVDDDAEQGGDGQSWLTPYNNLEDALAEARSDPGITEIHVAGGVYVPSARSDPNVPRTEAFQLINGVAAYGGYAGLADPAAPAARDPTLYQSILSADLNGDDGPGIANDVENGYHVFYHPEGLELDETAILEGFTIMGGRANGSYPHDGGGGMQNYGSSPAVVNCTFSGNSGTYGGGMGNRNNSSPAVTNSVFRGNSGYHGGGLYSTAGSSPTLINCTLIENSANFGSVLYDSSYRGTTLVNCTVTANLGYIGGGGISNVDGSLRVTNCILWGNTPPEIYESGFTAVDVTYSCIRGGYAGDGNIGELPEHDPEFVEGNGPDYDFHLRAGSAAIDAGSNSAVPAAILTDLDGNPRIQDGDNDLAAVVDLGAYEYRPDCNGNGIWDDVDIAAGTSNDCDVTRIPDECEPNGLADCDFNGITDLCEIQAGTSEDCNVNTVPDECEPGGVEDCNTNGSSDLCDLYLGISRDCNSNGVPDECEQLSTTLYVDCSVTGGAHDGSNWTDAYLELHQAVTYAVCALDTVTEVRVAQGIHVPDPTGLADPREAAFRLRNGLAVYGGFPPGGAVFEARDPVTYETILSGDLNGDDGPDLENAGENSYHVLHHPRELDLDETAVLDGFSITGGNANGTYHRHGGGMDNNSSSPTVAKCTFRANSAAGSGGGMRNHGSAPTVTDCAFQANSAGRSGGGMQNSYSNPVVTSCIFQANSAVTSGGGMQNSYSEPTVTNGLFVGNRASYGAGVENSECGDVILVNCTINGNRARSGGGIANGSHSRSVLTNCIVWGNVGSESPQIHDPYGDATVEHSCIQDGHPGDGNIYTDPIFAAEGYWDDNGTPDVPGDDTWVDGDYHLCADSPCIGVGNDDALPEHLTADFEGEERIQHCRVDLGADETPFYRDCNANATGDACDVETGTSEDCNSNDVPDECEPGGLEDCNANGTPDLCDIDAGTSRDCNGNIVPDDCETLPTKRLYVDAGATDGIHDGSSWADAYLSVQRALRHTVCVGGMVTEVWVAQGRYVPDSAGLSDFREATFQLVNGVAIYGGFPTGGGDGGFETRDPAAYETTLSGDIGIPGNPSDNCYNVFYHPPDLHLDETAVLDGFTVTGGNANGRRTGGAGMLNSASSPTLKNCRFRGNSAKSSGGGMSNVSGSSPTINNSTFQGNLAGYYGGGMYNLWGSSPTINNSTFQGNSARYKGGGMCNDYSSPTVANCLFNGNTVSQHEVGTPAFRTAPMVTARLDRRDPARCNYFGGAGMYNGSGSSPRVTNCVFSGNWAEHGGGIYNRYSTPTITNCILWGNALDEIHDCASGSGTVAYSCIEGGYVGQGNLDEDPLFVDAYGSDGIAGTEDDNLRLTPASPCIDAGNNDAVELLFDLDGNPRITDGDGDGTLIVDLGAYESPGVVVADLDVLPRICPNFWHPPAGGFLRVAVLGAQAFDVRKVQPKSVVLLRRDGIGEAVPPLWRLGPWIKDVGGPQYNGSGACTDSPKDGILDLKLRFETRRIVNALELRKVSGGTRVDLTMRGRLRDGTPFEAHDYIVIRRASPRSP